MRITLEEPNEVFFHLSRRSNEAEDLEESKDRAKSFAGNDTQVQNLALSHLPKSKEMEKRFQLKPYHAAVEKLREIDSMEGPMMKARLLEHVNRIIESSIEEFWKDVPVNKTLVTLTPDDKIPIYNYIVIK